MVLGGGKILIRLSAVFGTAASATAASGGRFLVVLKVGIILNRLSAVECTATTTAAALNISSFEGVAQGSTGTGRVDVSVSNAPPTLLTVPVGTW